MGSRQEVCSPLVIDLPPDRYCRLREVTNRLGKPVEALVTAWLAEHLSAPSPVSERERAREALRVAGLLTELSPEEKKRTARSTASLAEVQAAFARAG